MSQGSESGSVKKGSDSLVVSRHVRVTNLIGSDIRSQKARAVVVSRVLSRSAKRSQ